MPHFWIEPLLRAVLEATRLMIRQDMSLLSRQQQSNSDKDFVMLIQHVRQSCRLLVDDIVETKCLWWDQDTTET